MTDTTGSNCALATLVRQFAPIYAQLLISGFTRIIIEYEAAEPAARFMLGACDSAGKPATDRIDAPVVTELTRLLLALLTDRHPQWQKGPGSSGRFDWDLTTNALVHWHEQRELITNKFEHRGLE